MQYIFVIILFFNFCQSSIPNITLGMYNPGFHKELIYEINNLTSSRLDGCSYILEQQFPASVYIDSDELNQLIRIGKLNATYPSTIDIEAMTEKSQPFRISIFGVFGRNKILKIPIHFRYHAPQNKERFVKVQLKEPEMYIRCSNRNQLKNLNLKEKTCKTDFSINDSIIVKDCDWYHILYKAVFKTKLETEIPVGNSDLANIVSIITILVAWFGCGVIIFAINKKMKELDRKSA